MRKVRARASTDSDAEGQKGSRSILESDLLRRTALVLAVLIGIASLAARIALIQSPRAAATDYSQDYLSDRAWSDGLDPYTDTGKLVDRYFGSRSGYYDLLPPGQVNPHPPALIVLNRPLAFLPYRAARTIWLLFSAALTALAIALFARALGASRFVANAAALGSLGIPVVQTDLVYGQINGILLFLLVSAWLSLKRGKDSQAGFLLGLATALKVFPIFMILFFLKARKIRAAFWHVGTAAVLTLLAGLAIGFHAASEFLFKVSPANLRYWRAAPMNLSAFAIPFRWLTRSSWGLFGVNVPVLAWLIGAAILAIGVIGALRTQGHLTRDHFWEVALWMLLVTPIVWESYLVVLIPFVVLMFRRAQSEGHLPGLGTMLASIIVMVGLIPNLPAPLDVSRAVQLLGYSLPFYGLLSLTLLSLVGTRKPVNAS